MWKDPKIQLSLGLFAAFTILWGVLSLGFKIPANDPFMTFIAGVCAAVWSMVLIFIKPDGGISSSVIESPAPAADPAKDEGAAK